jgi:uncharacterized membrane protein YcfT
MNTAETVVVSILGFIAFFYVNLYAGSYRMRKAATSFLEALKQRRYSDAYALLSSEFKRSVPVDSFERFLNERGVFSIKEIKRHLGDFAIGTNQGTMEPWIIREDNIYFKLKLHMFREKMKWTVRAIDAQLRLMPAPVPATVQTPPPEPIQSPDRREAPRIH